MARASEHGASPPPSSDVTATTLAQDLLLACKRGNPIEQYRTALADATDTALRPVRERRETALAFWLNCYNAGTQLLLAEAPGRYASPLRFVRFFREPAVTVAGTALSLDRIEHGILRGGRSKYGLGYLPRLSVSNFERRFRLADCDPRIHFALNCGAESCPAIRVYEPDRVDEQLDLATERYLDATVTYDPDADVVHVPRVCLWYRGDFGGGSGIRDLLRSFDVIPPDVAPTIRHKSWDWTKAAGKFAT
jgi:hypothetical protein